jgi:SAM-dependent methyltransferase
MPASKWSQYITKTSHQGPRRLLLKALELVADRDAALDLGAGALNDSKHLLDIGFKSVMAIDREMIPEEVIKLEWAKDKADRFSFDLKSIEDFVFPPSAFNLINAQFVLPFIEASALPRVMSNIIGALRPGGIFTGQFFGPRDSWKDVLNVTLYSEEACRNFLSSLQILYFQEEEYDGPTALDGGKHWHIYNFITKKI